MKKVIRLLTLLFLFPVLPIIGAIKVKDISASATKWNENASRSSDAYRTGAEASAEEWARKTAAAADTYGMAITTGNIKMRFQRGVQKAGSAKYARKIRDVAGDRYAPGVAAAQTDYQSGAEPYFTTLAGLTLSQRKPRGDPGNYTRVQEVGKALNAKRLALLGGAG